MTKEDVIHYIIDNDLSLDMAIDYVQENGFGDTICSYDILKDFIKKNLDDDNIFMVVHLSTSIWEDEGVGEDYWVYDFSMGTMVKPYSIGTIAELCDYLDCF